MDAFVVQALLRGVLLPVAVAAGVALVGVMVRVPILGGAVALAAGVAASWAAFPWTPFPPSESWHYLPFAIASGVIPAIFIQTRWRSAAGITSFAVTAASAWYLIPTWPEFSATRIQWVIALAVAATALGVVAHVIAERSSARQMALILVLAGLANCINLERVGCAKFAQLGGVLLAVMGAAALDRVLRPASEISVGMIPGMVVGIVALSFLGYAHGFGDQVELSFILILASPVMPALALLLPRRWRIAGMLSMLLMLALASAAPYLFA